jgi:predicted glycoside hydrolase/deacetylase ChbG (UPF0249 family)
VVGSAILPGLVVNADDLGIHPDINAGILSAYRNGILTSCTMLMTTAYLDETVRDYVRSKALPIGIHLSLTLGRALAPANEIQDLVDGECNLKLSAASLLLRSYETAAGRALLRQIGRELEAQLGRARDFGLLPTHADTHQHVHMHPAIFALLEEILPRFGVYRLRYTREPFWPFMVGADFLAIARRRNLEKWALLRWRSGQIKRHLGGNDDFFGVLYSGIVSKHSLLATIEKVAATRSTEICIHPGFSAPKGVPYYPRRGYNDFVTAHARKVEHDILVDESLQAAVRRRGLALRAYNDRVKP